METFNKKKQWGFHTAVNRIVSSILVKFYTPCMSFKMPDLNNLDTKIHCILAWFIFFFLVKLKNMWMIYDGVWHVKYWGHHNLKMIYYFVLILIPYTGRNLLHLSLRFCNISFVIEIYNYNQDLFSFYLGVMKKL